VVQRFEFLYTHTRRHTRTHTHTHTHTHPQTQTHTHTHTHTHKHTHTHTQTQTHTHIHSIQDSCTLYALYKTGVFSQCEWGSFDDWQSKSFFFRINLQLIIAFITCRSSFFFIALQLWQSAFCSYWLMIAFITCKSSLVPLLEGLCTSNPCRFESSVFFSALRPSHNGSKLRHPQHEGNHKHSIIDWWLLLLRVKVV